MTASPDDVIDLPPDEPPSDGVFRDWDGAQHDPDLVAEGNRLGQAIDIDDDLDTGLHDGFGEPDGGAGW